MQARRRLIGTLVEAYLQDHIGGNHSEKTLEWHRTALGLMQHFFEDDLAIMQVEAVEADDISAWFTHLRTTPGARGKTRSERTVQTYARSARAFFHWLVRRDTLDLNPFDRVLFPKVGRPLIQTISTEEFEQLASFRPKTRLCHFSAKTLPGGASVGEDENPGTHRAPWDVPGASAPASSQALLRELDSPRHGPHLPDQSHDAILLQSGGGLAQPLPCPQQHVVGDLQQENHDLLGRQAMFADGG